MRREPYYQQLGQDLYQLGLIEAGNIPGIDHSPPTRYSSLIDLLHETQNIDDETAELVQVSDPDDLRTQVGKSIFNLFENQVSFDGRYQDACCGEAEWRLAANISSSRVADRRRPSPIIVTNDEEPYAIIKSYGEDTVYGLVTDRDHGIVAGAFSSHSPEVSAYYLPRIDTAWKVEIDDIGLIDPIRYSIFSLPTIPRAQLQGNPKERSVLQLTHKQIARQAGRLLCKARQLTEEDMLHSHAEADACLTDL